jgi:hypothetical protein
VIALKDRRLTFKVAADQTPKTTNVIAAFLPSGTMQQITGAQLP